MEEGLEDTLRSLGERGDIIKTMHREMAGKDIAHSPSDYAIHDPTDPNTQPVTGLVMARGPSDEINDRHYLIVYGVDGRTHCIDIGKGAETEPTPEGSVIRVASKSLEPRKVDRTVAEIAAANGGHYNIDIHLKHDPRATEKHAETHVRRLEAIRRAIGKIEREPNGTWIVTPDHLDRVTDYERGRATANSSKALSAARSNSPAANTPSSSKNPASSRLFPGGPFSIAISASRCPVSCAATAFPGP